MWKIKQQSQRWSTTAVRQAKATASQWATWGRWPAEWGSQQGGRLLSSLSAEFFNRKKTFHRVQPFFVRLKLCCCDFFSAFIGV